MRGTRPEENWLSLSPAAINCLAVPFLIHAGLLLLVTCEQATTAAMNWWVERPCHVQRALCAWPSPLSSHSTGHAFIAGPHRTSPGLTSHSLTASNLNLNLLFHIKIHHDLSLLYFAVGTLKPEYTTSNVFYRGIWVLASTDSRRLLYPLQTENLLKAILKTS